MTQKVGLIWGHSPKRVLCEPIGCVGSGTASSASRYYRKGFHRQVRHKFIDTEYVLAKPGNYLVFMQKKYVSVLTFSRFLKKYSQAQKV